jgi:hydrogenase maturation protease
MNTTHVKVSVRKVYRAKETTVAQKLVLGIGNILLHDEGVGVYAARAMQQVKLPEDVEVVDGGTSGADLVEVIADRPLVIVIDAMKSKEPPGTIYRFTDDDLIANSEAIISIHEFGLVETLLMARQLKCAPKQVIIFGVQPANITPGEGMTKEVANAVPKVIQAVMEELRLPIDSPQRHRGRRE